MKIVTSTIALFYLFRIVAYLQCNLLFSRNLPQIRINKLCIWVEINNWEMVLRGVSCGCFFVLTTPIYQSGYLLNWNLTNSDEHSDYAQRKLRSPLWCEFFNSALIWYNYGFSVGGRWRMSIDQWWDYSDRETRSNNKNTV